MLRRNTTSVVPQVGSGPTLMTSSPTVAQFNKKTAPGRWSSKSVSHGSPAEQIRTRSDLPDVHTEPIPKTRPRSSSLVTLQKVGTDDAAATLDQIVEGRANADWVNFKGAWMLHIVLTMVAKLWFDMIPGMTQDFSWTLLNIGYFLATFFLFHWFTGVPFEEAGSGVYDELTLWEQIDQGAQNTPAKKWLTLFPCVLFLLATHYTSFTSRYFALNLLVVVIGLVLKLPSTHRVRLKFGDVEPVSTISRGPSPAPHAKRE